MDLEEIRGIPNEAEQVNRIYDVFKEETRLTHSRAARVEFLTTTRYIEQYATPWICRPMRMRALTRCWCAGLCITCMKKRIAGAALRRLAGSAKKRARCSFPLSDTTWFL